MSERVHGERSHRDGHKKGFDLRTRIEQVMKGFHGVNAIAYKHKNEYVTYSRPADSLKVLPDDEFAPDRKEIWPVLNDMHSTLPIPRIRRRPNRVDDPSYTIAPSERTPIIPEPVFPQSKGLKLRPIDEIINDKKLFGKMAPPEQTSSTSLKKQLNSARASNSTKQKAFDAPSSKIQGVLDIITETSRKPAVPHKSTTTTTTTTTPPVKSRSKDLNVPIKSTTLSTPTANRPRKSSLLKSEIKEESIQPKMGSKKPMSSIANSIARPRVSSKSTVTQKSKYSQDIPDLIEARNYLLGETDEVEFRKMEHLLEVNHNTRDMRRPKLFLHFKKTIPAITKLAHKKSLPIAGKTIIKHEEIKKEPNVNKKINVTEKTASPTKLKSTITTTTTTTITPPPPPPPPTTTSHTPELPTIKKSLSDRSTTATTPTNTTTDKQAYPSSIPAAFLRSMKIPKRKSSEVELEEGETISPSPSPLHSSIVTQTQTPPPIAPTPVAAAIKSESKRSRNEESEDSATPITIAQTPLVTNDSSSSNSSSRKHSSRRDEERSSSSRRTDRLEERRSTTSKSHRSSHYRSKSRSRSRSRSPKRSSSGRSSSRRRQTSSDSTRRRPRSSDKRKNNDSKYEESSKRQRIDKENSRDKESSREKEKESIREKDSIKDKESSREKDSTREKESKYTTSSSKKPSPSTPTLSEKTISATAPNAETPEQFKIFSLMFNKLAHANKRRGDTQTDPVFGIIDHFHAFCDYILNFYYIDRLNMNANFKQATAAWKSIFPFTDSLLKKLESRKELELHGLCIRLNSLIRFYMYSRMESSTRPVLLKQINNTNEKMTDRACVELSENLLHEYEKAERAYKDSEKHMSYGTLVTKYPETFKNVCMEGNLLAGITLGGEAGVSVGPMFPFAPYSPLHHAAIVSKCILSEYVSKNNLKYTPISNPDEFM